MEACLDASVNRKRTASERESILLSSCRRHASQVWRAYPITSASLLLTLTIGIYNCVCIIVLYRFWYMVTMKADKIEEYNIKFDFSTTHFNSGYFYWDMIPQNRTEELENWNCHLLNFFAFMESIFSCFWVYYVVGTLFLLCSMEEKWPKNNKLIFSSELHCLILDGLL